MHLCVLFFSPSLTPLKEGYSLVPVFWQQPFETKNHVVIINFAWDQLWPQLSFEMQLHEKQTELISSPLGLLGNKA